jgi:hypothetical protein
MKVMMVGWINLDVERVKQKKIKFKSMKTKYIKIYSTSLLIGIFTFLAVSSGESSSKSSNESKPSSESESASLGTRFNYLTEPIDDLESGTVRGINNEKELYEYLDDVAIYWIGEWKKAQQFQNENRKFEEMLLVSRCIDAYPLGIYQGIIVLNDLPTHLGTKAENYFDKKVKFLGYNSNWISERHKSNDIEESDSYYESYYNESSENDDYYNRQQEQAEYESSQAYYNSNEFKETVQESETKNSQIQETEILYKTTILRSPESRKDFANVFWNKEYTLFDKLTDEPIFAYKKNGLLIYKIYCTTSESLVAEYVELSPEQLQKKTAYKFLNFENCNKWIESKKRKLNKN